jgi:hypothetical protein
MRKLTCALLLAILAAGSAGTNIWVEKGRLFTGDGLFHRRLKDPHEYVILILYTEEFYIITTHEEGRVGITVAHIRELLNRDNRGIKDIAIIVHNHHRRTVPSEGDGVIYKRLRNNGFTGAFLIYHVPTRTVRRCYDE